MFSFNHVIDILNRKEFNMPNQWIYGQYFTDDARLLIFFIATCNKMENYEDKYSFNPFKEVLLKENMTIQLNILRQPINMLNIPPHIRIHENINSIDELQETLFSFDNASICCGADNSNNVIESVEYNEAYEDICGTWRHKKCLLFSSFNSKKCTFCSVMKKSINQKHRRMKIVKLIKRIKITVPITEKQEKILLIRKRYYKAQKAKNRAKYIINKLRKELTDNMTKIKEISVNNVEDQLKGTHVSRNQLIAVQEIIKAAKLKNTKGRRYSEEWILLCMLLHMKSPKAYDFIRDNQILSLPCIRTIQR
ncbi:uncharacterized protein [Temnothorax longispinosus]|uniref:uncharacterized protein n=1 Tax=Temnothorax longispinosus TaxID=300112 RepID=UPI003A98CF79